MRDALQRELLGFFAAWVDLHLRGRPVHIACNIARDERLRLESIRIAKEAGL